MVNMSLVSVTCAGVLLMMVNDDAVRLLYDENGTCYECTAVLLEPLHFPLELSILS